MTEIIILTNGSHFSNLLNQFLIEKGYATNIINSFEEIKDSNNKIIVYDCFAVPLDSILENYNLKKKNFTTLPLLFYKLHNMLAPNIEKILEPFDSIIDFDENIENVIQRINSVSKKIDIYSKFVGTDKVISQPQEVYEKYKILLVDDDQYIIKLLSHNLNNAGYECLTANSANEAFEIIKYNIPDLILSDVMMPDIDGFEFRKRILQDEKLKDVPFVFLTSKSDEDDMLSAYDLSITDYIVKTSGPKLVVAKVSSILKSLGKERQKVVKELNKALDNFQLKVVPDIIPQISKFEVKHWHQPYQGIPGGDFIDYYKIDDNKMLVVLGDVMGKKWNAWYFAVAYAGYVRSSIRFTIQNTDIFTPATIIEKVNKTVYNDAKIAEVFATLSVLLLDGENNIILYSGAGDLPIYHVTSEGIKSVQSNGLLLGFNDLSTYEDISIECNSGDVVLLTTDGVMDSRNSLGKPYGEEQFVAFLPSLYKDPAPLELLKNNFSEYVNNVYEDDISLISIRVI
jgi:sigma-B regulation protein RsbU (phosphoserine phosphatase)